MLFAINLERYAVLVFKVFKRFCWIRCGGKVMAAMSMTLSDKAAIANVVGPRIQLVDSANTTAGQLKVALTELGLLQDEASVGRLQCWVTDGPERFIRVARLFLGHELDPNLVQLVDL